MDDFEGKVAVVTGAGSGIGRALTRCFARQGMRVLGADVEGPNLDETARLTEAEGRPVTTLVVDVSRADEVDALAAYAFDTFGSVNLLCNNAGVFQGGLLWECTEADFAWALGVNLWGILHGIRSFVPRMLAGGAPGHIVNTASMAGLFTTPFSGPYNVSKFAAVAASECLAHDLAAVGASIGVSVLCPSLVDTAIGSSRRNRPAHLAEPMTNSGAFVEQALAGSTAGSLAPDDVAEIVLAAVRAGDFLIPTKDSFAAQISQRTDALLARRQPPMPSID